jgi:Flp pilus assembly protein TadG
MNERGTSTLEMILALPFLLFMLFGIAEISRLWHTVNVVTLASRDGARVGATTADPFSAGPAIARIDETLDSLLGPGATGVTRSVTCNAAPCSADAQVTATVTVTFQTLIPLVGDLVPNLASIPVRQTTVMRRE